MSWRQKIDAALVELDRLGRELDEANEREGRAHHVLQEEWARSGATRDEAEARYSAARSTAEETIRDEVRTIIASMVGGPDVSLGISVDAAPARTLIKGWVCRRRPGNRRFIRLSSAQARLDIGEGIAFTIPWQLVHTLPAVVAAIGHQLEGVAP